MQIYNPFKPHLCQFSNGLYGVRKLSLDGWAYFDQTGQGIWHLGESSTFSSYANLFSLLKYPIREKKIKSKIVKKIT